MSVAWQGVDQTLREWVDQHDFSGTVLVTRGDATLFSGCYGWANRADKVPVTTRTRFGLASITKMFTAVATVSLMAENRLPYDTPVVELLPAERRPSTLRDDVTVHHLLTHTSGMADYFDEETEDDYSRLWATRPSYAMRTTADFLPLFADLPPYTAPGVAWRYSNAGYIMLGLLIEELSAQPYPVVVSERVFAPAGMADSGFLALDEVHPDVATGYSRPSVPGGPWRSNIYSVPALGGPDGGALATAADVDRFLRYYANGELLSPDLRDLMLTPCATGAMGGEYGYGVHLLSGPAGALWGHDGGDPGVEAIAYHLPERGLNVIALCNMEYMVGRVRDLILAAPGPAKL